MRRVLVATVLALGATVLAPSTAQAAPASRIVVADVSQTDHGSTMTVTVIVRVLERDKGAPVRLQSLTGGRWTNLDTARMKKSGRVKLSGTVGEGRFTLRAFAPKTRSALAASSPRFTVENAPVTDPDIEPEAPQEPEPETPEPDASGPEPLPLGDARTLILQELNEARAANGLAPLLLMEELNAIAQDWSLHMAAAGACSNNPTVFEQYPRGFTGGAEIVLTGFFESDAVDAWLRSASHSRHILNDYTHIGIGVAAGDLNSRYYTVDFARYP